jgi:SAM-dependent methyltransferase
MELAQVYGIERAKWDELARRKRSDSELMLAPGLDFHSYYKSESALDLDDIADFMGDLRGKRVIEYGCGFGFLSVLLAKSGAHVDAFDLSAESAAVARRRAELNGVGESITFHVVAAEDLPFASGTFDAAVGNAVLHHLDVGLAGPELFRVLKPGARAAFSEPLGMNPLLAFARDHIPYPGKNPRGADVPLTYDDLRAWGAPFNEFSYQEIQLLSMVERALGRNRRFDSLRAADRVLLSQLPFLRRYCRYVLLYMTKGVELGR